MSPSYKKSSFIFQYFLMSTSVCCTDVQALGGEGSDFLAGIFWLTGSRSVWPEFLIVVARIVWVLNISCKLDDYWLNTKVHLKTIPGGLQWLKVYLVPFFRYHSSHECCEIDRKHLSCNADIFRTLAPSWLDEIMEGLFKAAVGIRGHFRFVLVLSCRIRSYSIHYTQSSQTKDGDLLIHVCQKISALSGAKSQACLAGEKLNETWVSAEQKEILEVTCTCESLLLFLKMMSEVWY